MQGGAASASLRRRYTLLTTPYVSDSRGNPMTVYFPTASHSAVNAGTVTLLPSTVS
jgi:hypothetical protein